MRVLYFMLGAPGAGKTTLIEKTSQDIFGSDILQHCVVSPDNIRKMINFPEQQVDASRRYAMSSEELVWEMVFKIIDQKAKNGEMIVVDATHTREAAIRIYKKYKEEHRYQIKCIDFTDVSLETLLERNGHRTINKVPNDRIETLWYRSQLIEHPNWYSVIKPHEFANEFSGTAFDETETHEKIYIGDIHGCADELKLTLKAAGVDWESNEAPKNITFLGDYFDRGPSAKSIVETATILLDLIDNHNCQLIQGNHEGSMIYFKSLYKAALPHINIFLEQKGFGKIAAYRDIDKLHRILDEDLLKELRYELFWTLFKKKEFINVDSATATDVKNIRFSARRSMLILMLSHITRNDLMKIWRKMVPYRISSFIFQGKRVHLYSNHTGTPSVPNLVTPANELINGIGVYEDIYEIANVFKERTQNVIQFSGHRNPENKEAMDTFPLINLNGDVSIGIRACVINNSNIRIINQEPTEKTKECLRTRRLKKSAAFAVDIIPEEEHQKVLEELKTDQGTVCKELYFEEGDEKIESVNFKSSVFQKGHWSDITLRARGLFLTQNNPIEIVARGYNKFFNLNERMGLTPADFESLNYPVSVFDKPNGFLGLVSVRNGKWFFASKSTIKGDYPDMVREHTKDFLTPNLLIKLQELNATLVFEIIDPVKDPHIVGYPEGQAILLDIIYNELNFKKMSYEGLLDFNSVYIGAPVKEIVDKLHNSLDLSAFINQYKRQPLFIDDGFEGFVFEDNTNDGQSPIMFKLKTPWYSFWKRVRGIEHKVNKYYLNQKKGGFTKEKEILVKKSLHIAEEFKVLEALKQIHENGEHNLDVPTLRRKIIKILKEEK